MRMRIIGAVVLGTTLGCSSAAGEGDRLFRAGETNGAITSYERAVADGDTSARARYNLGTALLVAERYEDARTQFDAAVAAAKDSTLAFRATYNAGLADLAPVAAGQAEDAQRTTMLSRAIVRYRQALLLVPGDADAKWNLELAQRLLARSGGRGGGGGDQGDAGGGEGNSPAPASPKPSPGASGNRPMTQAEAERVLAGAAEREQRVQRQQLKAGDRPAAGVRDW